MSELSQMFDAPGGLGQANQYGLDREMAIAAARARAAQVLGLGPGAIPTPYQNQNHVYGRMQELANQGIPMQGLDPALLDSFIRGDATANSDAYVKMMRASGKPGW